MRRDLRRAYCPKCRHRQTFERYGIRHGLHFLLALFTGGLWLVSWFALILGSRFRPWCCEQCGIQQFGLASLPKIGSEHSDVEPPLPTPLYAGGTTFRAGARAMQTRME